MFSITNLMSKVSSFLSSANSLSNQIDNRIKKTPPILLGNIQLQLVSEVSESYSNDVPTVPIDDGTQIADNITPNPLELSFKVQIVGANHKEIFEKVIELRNKRELVDLYMVKLYKNMAITSIENTITSLYYTEFTITLVEIKIAHVSMIPAPSKKAKPAVRKKTKIKTTAKAKNKTSGKKDWEGDLQSEHIKLP
ncbi:hypothetical protein CBG60_00350 [Fusobacterium animalis]|uniref:Dit-like phage tail protein N-terminal domain-containing protein n=1 Tax=Fusobacterium animalis 7_1 TaxID=457405 RepID=A0A140PTL7_9FUSO|nr:MULTISPECIES: hypothetical protein [Fusobacterium]ALF22156.1 hypothetical protein RO08_07520 [Fusobacterium animalis]ASG29872.1 hypothetical protein CBG60_00350 [Fusobacterium animalis]EEO42718.1 hypothetical protein FSDG_01277 [Fusobacterium animalis 7_1]EHG19335.2 hypothetical protein HMPREF9369_00912 [Fusobacterium polymorphum F0401]ERT41349.1 hypothetical protein HMPREF1538_00961 [Fusobacterium nucleatum CTI-1]